MGLFYPNGLNGVINGSSASAAALSTDIAGRRKLQVRLCFCRLEPWTGLQWT